MQQQTTNSDPEYQLQKQLETEMQQSYEQMVTQMNKSLIAKTVQILTTKLS